MSASGRGGQVLSLETRVRIPPSLSRAGLRSSGAAHAWLNGEPGRAAPSSRAGSGYRSPPGSVAVRGFARRVVRSRGAAPTQGSLSPQTRRRSATADPSRESRVVAQRPSSCLLSRLMWVRVPPTLSHAGLRSSGAAHAGLNVEPGRAAPSSLRPARDSDNAMHRSPRPCRLPVGSRDRSCGRAKPVRHRPFIHHHFKAKRGRRPVARTEGVSASGRPPGLQPDSAGSIPATPIRDVPGAWLSGRAPVF